MASISKALAKATNPCATSATSPAADLGTILVSPETEQAKKTTQACIGLDSSRTVGTAAIVSPEKLVSKFDKAVALSGEEEQGLTLAKQEEDSSLLFVSNNDEEDAFPTGMEVKEEEEVTLELGKPKEKTMEHVSSMVIRGNIESSKELNLLFKKMKIVFPDDHNVMFHPSNMKYRMILGEVLKVALSDRSNHIQGLARLRKTTFDDHLLPKGYRKDELIEKCEDCIKFRDGLINCIIELLSATVDDNNKALFYFPLLVNDPLLLGWFYYHKKRYDDFGATAHTTEDYNAFLKALAPKALDDAKHRVMYLMVIKFEWLRLPPALVL